MNKKLHLRHWPALLLAMLLLLPSVVQAQQKRDIHELFRQTAGSRSAAPASNETINVDLSEWESDYDTPIVIGTGLNYKFTNGVLRKKNDGTWQGGALIVVQNGSVITLGETASFDGGNFQSADPVVEVKDGRFIVSGGSVIGVYGWTNATENTNGNTAVKLTDVNNPVLTPLLRIWNGSIVGRVDNNTETGDIYLSGGSVGRLSTSRDVHMKGQAKILTNLYFYSQTAKVLLSRTLENTLRLSNYTKDQLVVDADKMFEQVEINIPPLYSRRREISQDFYTITSSDLEKIILGGSNASLYRLSLENNSVYVRERNSANQTIENVEPGTLPDRITDPDNIEELTLTGRLNGTDIVLLQDMSKKKLRKLDISGCHIVSGGSAYYTGASNSYYTANNEISSSMFYKTTSLEVVILPNSIKKIDGSSFNYGSLKSITIGPNVSTISGGLCPGTKLEEIILNGNNNFVVDGGILYDAKRTTIYRAVVGLTGEVNIPNNIKTIENSAFDGCSLITKVVLPSDLNEVETASFDDCTSLTEVVFNANLTRLGYDCFANCTSLKIVDLSNTKVDYIYQSFYGCNAIETLLLPKTIGEIWGPSFTSRVLKYISCPATTPPTLSHADKTFAYSSIKNICKLIVPTTSISKYKAAAGWKEFYNIVDDNPNLITNEDELQRRLNEIAEQKPTSPVTLTIQDGGVVITKPVIAEEDCNVIITGGMITLSKNFNFANKKAVFFFNGSVTLQNITIDCNSVSSPYHFMWCDGNVTIGSGVTYLNPYEGNFIFGFYFGLGNLRVSSGDLSLGGTVFYPTHDGKFYIDGGNFSCPADKQLVEGDGELFVYGGSLSGGGIDFSGAITLGLPQKPVTINIGKITGGGTLKVVTVRSDSAIPEIDVTYRVVIFSSQSASTANNYKFSADWPNMELGKAFVVSGSEYSPITQDVLDHIEFIGMPADREAYYDETEHSVKLRERVVDPNLIADEDWLQQRLDEIAADKPTEPVTLTIRDEGIMLTKTIIFKEGCNVVLTGGKLTVDATKFQSWRVFSVSSNSNVTFQDITIDFNGGVDGAHSSYFANSGTLIIGKNVRYLNVSKAAESFFLNEMNGQLIVHSGDVEFNGIAIYSYGGTVRLYGGTISSTANMPVYQGSQDEKLYLEGGTLKGIGNLIVDAKTFFMYDGTLQGNDNSILVAERTDCMLGGGTLIGGYTYGNGSIGCDVESKFPRFELKSGRIDVTTNVRNIIVWGKLPEIYMGKDAIVENIMPHPDNKYAVTLNGDWANMEQGHVLIKKVSSAMFEKITFVDLSYNIEVYYDETDNSVKLREKFDPANIADVEPGTLPDRLPEEYRDTLTELTITGWLNGTDIKLIRQLANTSLKQLDISGCSIVSGGDEYLTSDYKASASKQMVDLSYSDGTPDRLRIVRYKTANDTIGTYMFAGLSKLQKVVLPNSVTTINHGAFMDSPQLTSITFGSSVNKFTSNFLFYGSNNITELAFTRNGWFRAVYNTIYDAHQMIIVAVSPATTGTYQVAENVDSIAPYAFAGCMDITNVNFNTKLTCISDYAFCQSGLRNIVLPTTVTSIGKGAFSYCERLASVTFAEGIKSIDYGAFANCALTEADLSMTQVTELGGDEHSYPIATPTVTYTYHVGVFEGTNTLTTVKLPATLQEMGGKVFTSTQLADIYSYATVPPTIYYQYVYTPAAHQVGGTGWDSSDTFDGVDYKTCRLHIPQRTLDGYKAVTGWKEFLNVTKDLPNDNNPNLIDDEEWLQQRLNEIAEEKPVTPVVLTIQDDGITLTKSVYFLPDCKVILTGGKLTVNSTNFSSDWVFKVNNGADVTFQAITVDFSDFKKYYFVSNGALTIDHNVTYENVNETRVKTDFYSNGQGAELSVSGAMNFTVEAGIVKVGENLTDVDLTKDAVVNRLMFSSPLTISADWKGMANKHVIIKSLSAENYKKIAFTGLPYTDGRWSVEYDAANQQALLHKMTLQEWLDRNNDADEDTGTEDNPMVVELPDEDLENGDLWNGDPVDLGRETGGRHVHYWWRDSDWRIDPASGWPWRPTLRLKTDIRIWFGSSLRWSQIYISGMNSDKYVYVYGTLVIDVDVYIRFFNYRFIRVMPGGRVIWRGGKASTVGHLIYNEGGTVVYEGGNSDYAGKNHGFHNTGSGSTSISGGTVSGGVSNSGTGTVNISGGTISHGYRPAVINTGGGCVNISGGHVWGYYPRGGKTGGYDTPDIDNQNGTLWLTGGEIGEGSTGIVRTQGDLWIGGGVQLGHVWMSRSVRIHIISRLTVVIRFHFFISGEFDVEVPIIFGDEGYTLTADDLKMIDIELPDDYKYVIRDGKIVIVKKKKGDIHDLFEPTNTPDSDESDPEEPYTPDTPDGVVVDGDTTLPDIHILFGSLNASVQTTFVIDNSTLTVQSASTMFSHVDLQGIGTGHIETFGTVVIDEGTEVSGFQQFIKINQGGSLIWQGGTTTNVDEVVHNDGGDVNLVSGKLDGLVYSNVSITASGSVEVRCFVLQDGATIRVTSQLTTQWTIKLVGNMSAGARAAVAGVQTVILLESTDAYELMREDMNHVKVELPEGWYLDYDDTAKAIVMRQGTTPDDVTALTASGGTFDIYDMIGRKVRRQATTLDDLPGGVYIIGGKKVVVRK